MEVQQLIQVFNIVAWALFGMYVIRFLSIAIPQKGLVFALYDLAVRRIVYVWLLVALGLWAFGGSLVFVQPNQAGVVISVIAPDGYRDRPLRSGLRWIVPLLEHVVTYPLSWQTYTMSSKPNEGERVGDDSISARTSDGQEVSLDSSIIFQLDPEQLIRINIEWQQRYIADFVRPVLRGVIRTQVSQYTVDEVNSSKRLDLERDINQLLRSDLAEKGFVMDRFILRNIAFSPEYAASVEKKQVALQMALEKEHEADQIRRLAQGQADQVKTLAEADANATRVKAAAQSEALKLIASALERNPNLVTYEYVEKLAPNVKVMLVPSNAPYFLPLPAMDDTKPGSVVTSTTPISPTSSITATVSSLTGR